MSTKYKGGRPYHPTTYYVYATREKQLVTMKPYRYSNPYINSNLVQKYSYQRGLRYSGRSDFSIVSLNRTCVPCARGFQFCSRSCGTDRTYWFLLCTYFLFLFSNLLIWLLRTEIHAPYGNHTRGFRACPARISYLWYRRPWLSDWPHSLFFRYLG